MSRDSFFIVPNAPSALDLGVDCMTYETGPLFGGLSLVPPGMHFIYHSTGMGARSGFFIQIPPNDVVAREFDVSTEEILAYSTFSDEAMAHLRQSIRAGELNKNLGTYPFAQHGSWVNLSSYISVELLNLAQLAVEESIDPGEPDDMLGLVLDSRTRISTPSAHQRDSSGKPNTCGGSASPVYCDIACIERELTLEVKRDSAAITSMHLDKSPLLYQIARKHFGCKWEHVLGELQLSFVLFIMLYSYPSLQHWKRLVHVLANCSDAIAKKPKFYSTFIRILYEQLNFCPTDFFEDELSKDNFLSAAMTSLFQNMAGVPLTPGLAEHKKRLLVFVNKKFGLFDEAGQDGGVVMSREGVLLHRGLYDLVEEDLPTVCEEHDQVRDAPPNSSSAGTEAMVVEELNSRLAQLDSAMEAAAAQYNRTPAHFDSTDVHLDDHLAFNNSPISVAVSDGPLATTRIASAPMTAVEIENALYSWRYPHLFDEMVRAGGTEDLTMTAMRIYDTSDGVASRRGAYLEARMFVEEEVPRRSVC